MKKIVLGAIVLCSMMLYSCSAEDIQDSEIVNTSADDSGGETGHTPVKPPPPPVNPSTPPPGP